MGVDISGINPVVVGERPDYPNWDEATEVEKETYWKAIDKYNTENPGVYFRSNWWSWRPIHIICDVVSSKYDLMIDTKGWGENSGYGIKNQEDCNLLADSIEKYLSENMNSTLTKEDDRIYLCFGSWTTNDGKFISPIPRSCEKAQL
jgi:hypothetical protein